MERVIALGFFDGVHIGHGALLKKTREIAAKLNIIPSVITFDVPPMKNVELLTSPADRKELISQLYGVDDVILLHFDKQLRNTEWYDFVTVLRDYYGARHLVAGYDFRFGRGGMGNAGRLIQKCAELSVGCDIIGKIELCGEAVTSTGIREMIRAGNLEKAALFLGHPFSLSGSVCHGRGLGHALGVPTVNVSPSSGMILPPHGVYVTRTHLSGGGSFESVTNVGVRPTVSKSGRISVETNLFSFSGDLYEEHVRIDFLKFLREERSFADLDSLKAQIELDEKAAKAYFE